MTEDRVMTSSSSTRSVGTKSMSPHTPDRKAKPKLPPPKSTLLNLSNLPQSSQGRSHGGGSGGGDGVSTTSNGALARLAVPDAGSVSSDGGLAAEGAGVLGVLGDFHLLHLLSERGTITG